MYAILFYPFYFKINFKILLKYTQTYKKSSQIYFFNVAANLPQGPTSSLIAEEMILKRL